MNDSTSVSTASDSTQMPGSPTLRDKSAYLVFRVDTQPYACPIDRVHHLIRLADARLGPNQQNAPSWETGRLMIADETAGIPIISLRALWGLPPAQDRGEARQALLIADLAGQSGALLVDTCLCVLPALPGRTCFHLPDALKSARGMAMRTAVPWEKSLLVTLELDQLIPRPAASEPQPEQFSPQCL